MANFSDGECYIFMSIRLDIVRKISTQYTFNCNIVLQREREKNYSPDFADPRPVTEPILSAVAEKWLAPHCTFEMAVKTRKVQLI